MSEGAVLVFEPKPNAPNIYAHTHHFTCVNSTVLVKYEYFQDCCPILQIQYSKIIHLLSFHHIHSLQE